MQDDVTKTAVVSAEQAIKLIEEKPYTWELMTYECRDAELTPTAVAWAETCGSTDKRVQSLRAIDHFGWIGSSNHKSGIHAVIVNVNHRHKLQFLSGVGPCDNDYIYPHFNIMEYRSKAVEEYMRRYTPMETNIFEHIFGLKQSDVLCRIEFEKRGEHSNCSPLFRAMDDSWKLPHRENGCGWGSPDFVERERERKKWEFEDSSAEEISSPHSPGWA